MSSPTRSASPFTPEPEGTPDQNRFASGALVAGRYRVVALLGRGGMGEVYRADDLKLRQTVALKFLPPQLQSEPGRLAAFHREVRLARAVTHPNVCRVHDIGEVDGVHFLSMEYVDGEDLGSLLRRIGRLPRDKALEVAHQLCSGLAAAHERGVVHRDLKPANVMIDGRGRVRITDFGLAVVEREAAGEVAGTPGYMAPEQLAGEPATARGDLYALGLVLYEIMTGRPAFAGGSAREALQRQRDSTPPTPSSIVPEIEAPTERVILRCLEKDPARRPPSALAVAAALPGGDPLAALVAAGETPPPEMVADAGGAGALRPALAWALLGFVAVAIPIGLRMIGAISLIGPEVLDKPPEALADRARDLLRGFGAPPAAHDAMGFRNDPAALARRDWARAVRFWYRLSPEPLQPQNPFALVSPGDPPPLLPGMATLWLDPHGRLLAFQVVPSTVPGTAGGSPQWGPFFEEAGLDQSRFARAEVSRPPPVGADALEAWTGSDASVPEARGGAGFTPAEPRGGAGGVRRSTPPLDEAPLRVEAASWRGRPVYFEIFRGEDERGAAHASAAPIGFFWLAIVISALVLLKRNLRRGRGDRGGAFRLAAVSFAATLLSWVLEVLPGTDPQRVWRVVVAGTELGLWNAAFIWVFYLAIEPFLRRRWPESLISWSRLLAGRWRDPRVGRDVLVGIASMWGLWLVVGAAHAAPRLWGGEPAPLAAMDVGVAIGLRPILVWLVDGVIRSLSICVVFLVLLLVMRTLLRRLWAAFLGVGLLAALLLAPASIPGALWTDALGAALFVVALLGIAARGGLLATATIGFFVDPRFPLSGSLGAWYGWPTLALVLFSAALALYGFVVSLGGRSPFGEGEIED